MIDNDNEQLIYVVRMNANTIIRGNDNDIYNRHVDDAKGQVDPDDDDGTCGIGREKKNDM